MNLGAQMTDSKDLSNQSFDLDDENLSQSFLKENKELLEEALRKVFVVKVKRLI
jgi:hypothetical protein